MLAADPKTLILGLSATPGRSTLDAHEDLKLAEYFGRKKVSLEVQGYDSPVDYLQDEGYLATVNYERLSFKFKTELELSQQEISSMQRGFDVPLTVLKKLGSNEQRNLLILSHILDECEDSKKKIIVFACSVNHAYLIANILICLLYTSPSPRDS